MYEMFISIYLNYEAFMKIPITDLDIPPIYRTQANYWQAKYFEAYKELVKANKGIRRLKRKIQFLSNQNEKV